MIEFMVSKMASQREECAMKFERNWCEVSGQRFLYVRPKTMVKDKDWMDFFDAELVDYQNDLFLILVDVVGIEEDIGIELFSHISETLARFGVRRARFAVLPSNSFYPILAKLLENLAKLKEIDMEVQLFQQRDAAEAWLGSQ